MQNCIENTEQLTTAVISAETQTDYPQERQHAEDSYSFNRCVWQQQEWQTYLPPTPDSYMWSPTSPQSCSINYGMKPMMASAPVTPDVIPYHGKYFPTSSISY